MYSILNVVSKTSNYAKLQTEISLYIFAWHNARIIYQFCGVYGSYFQQLNSSTNLN